MSLSKRRGGASFEEEKETTKNRTLTGARKEPPVRRKTANKGDIEEVRAQRGEGGQGLRNREP